MKKLTLVSVTTLLPTLLLSSAASAGAKHMGAGIALPTEQLSASPWFLAAGGLLIAILALRVWQSARR